MYTSALSAFDDHRLQSSATSVLSIYSLCALSKEDSEAAGDISIITKLSLWLLERRGICFFPLLNMSSGIPLLESEFTLLNCIMQLSFWRHKQAPAQSGLLLFVDQIRSCAFSADATSNWHSLESRAIFCLAEKCRLL